MSFKDAIDDLQRIDGEDFKRIGTAPVVLRGLLILVGGAVVIGAAAHFLVKPQFAALEVAERKEVELRKTFDIEQSKAANRTAYVEQLEEMKKTFNVMLRQLPNKTDIESLLVDLSQTSVASGLEVENFQPRQEILREFYAEYPIEVSVTGEYHQFGKFVSGLAALPRIVTLNEIKIEELDERAAAQSTNGARLKMDLTATTYRYLEEDE